MSLPSINLLHLTVSEIQPGQDFIGQGHYGKVFPAARPTAHPDTMGENSTPTALKGCGVKPTPHGSFKFRNTIYFEKRQK